MINKVDFRRVRKIVKSDYATIIPGNKIFLLFLVFKGIIKIYF